MDFYTERFRNHRIHDTLRNLVSQLETVKLDDPEELAGFGRFRRVASLVEKTLNSVDPELTTPDMLNHLDDSLRNMTEHFEVFLGNHDWRNLNGPVDPALGHLRLLPLYEFPDGAHGFADALGSFRETATLKLNGLKAEIDKTSQDSSTHLDALKKQVQSLNGKLVENDQKFETQKGRVDELINTQQEQFSAAQDTRTKQDAASTNAREERFVKAQGEREQDFTARFEDLAGRFARDVDSHNKNANDLLKQLADHESHAKKIVGITGNIGLTGDFQKVADRESSRANWMRGFCLGFLTAMVGVVGWVVIDIGKETIEWENALFRVAVGLVFFAPAWYCGRESSRHRKVEHRNRRLELEFATINPYLETLGEDEAKAIITELAPRYFGVDQESGEEDVPPGLKSLRGDQLLKIVEAVAKIVKAKG